MSLLLSHGMIFLFIFLQLLLANLNKSSPLVPAQNINKRTQVAKGYGTSFRQLLPSTKHSYYLHSVLSIKPLDMAKNSIPLYTMPEASLLSFRGTRDSF